MLDSDHFGGLGGAMGGAGRAAGGGGGRGAEGAGRSWPFGGVRSLPQLGQPGSSGGMPWYGWVGLGLASLLMPQLAAPLMAAGMGLQGGEGRGGAPTMPVTPPVDASRQHRRAGGLKNASADPLLDHFMSNFYSGGGSGGFGMDSFLQLLKERQDAEENGGTGLTPTYYGP